MKIVSSPISSGLKSVNSALLSSVFLLAAPVLLQASVLGFVEYEPTSALTTETAVSSDGKHVYAVQLGTSGISGTEGPRINTYTRDAATGELEFVNVFKGGEDFDATFSFHPDGIIVSPDGLQVYVLASFGKPGDAVNFRSSLMRFSRNVETGELTYEGRLASGEDFNGLGNPSGSMAFSPDGFYLYAGDIGGNGQIVVFKRENNGVLSHVETVTQDANGDDLETHIHLSVSPDGGSVYATSLEGVLYSYTRNPVTGKLTALQAFHDSSNFANENKTLKTPGLENAEDSITSADGKFVYVTSKLIEASGPGTNDLYDIAIFSRNTSSGELTFVKNVTNTVPNGSTPWDTLWWPTTLLLSPDDQQKFLYVTGTISDSINVFRRDAESGDLSWIGWEQDRPGVDVNASSMTMSADGYHLYAAVENGVSVFDTRADMSVVKNDSVDPVESGGSYSYTFSVTNNGPSDAQNVVVTDALPTGVQYVSGSVNAPGTSCSETAGTVSCEFGPIATTGVVNATIEVSAPANEGSLNNTAVVSADQPDSEIANNQDSEFTTVQKGGANPIVNPGPTNNTESSSSGGGALSPLFYIALSMFGLVRSRKK